MSLNVQLSWDVPADVAFVSHKAAVRRNIIK
jgi:hypothetical protein